MRKARRPDPRETRAASRALPAAAAILSAVLLLFADASASDLPEVTRHVLAVRVDPAGRSLAGSDVLSVRTGGKTFVTFSLSPEAEVEGVSSGGKGLSHSFAGGILRVALPAGIAASGEGTLSIAYRVPFRESVPAVPANADDPGYGIRGSIGDRGTFLGDDAGWYPEIPGSRPSFRISVEGPAGYEAVTQGALVRRETSGGRTRTVWEGERAVEGLSLSAGRYRVRERREEGIPLYTFFYPETDPLSEKYLSAVSRYLALYREFFGPYPFEKFAVVENFFPTGYGFPSYTLLGSAVVRLPFIVETSLGHEVAHSWWGNGVLVDYDRGNWSEGLATYVADHLYREMISPEEGAEYRRNILRDYASLVPPGEDFPLASFTRRDSPHAGAIGYGKGAMVFHMAKRRAGDDAFFRALKRICREKMFLRASWDDFGRALAEESGADFAGFFRQWVHRKGGPVLSLSDVRAEREGNGWRVSGNVSQEKPYYDLRIPVRLAAEKGTTDFVVELSGRGAKFSIFSPSRPVRLSADPDSDVFRRLHPSEVPPSVNAIRGSKDLLVVSARSLPADALQASALLLAALGRKDLPILREEETPASRLAGHDVLILGVPEREGYLRSLPEGLSLSPDRFVLRGKRFDSPGDALFAVLPHPSDEGRSAAVFLPLSAEAAVPAARKVPHYGRYGYLVFSNGANVEKGSWETASFPLVREFPAPHVRRRSPAAASPVDIAVQSGQN